MPLNAPGLRRVRRKGGVELYWVCSVRARKLGYSPRTVRLFYDLGSAESAASLEEHCRRLQKEMMEWLGEPEISRKVTFDGKLGTLIRLYQSDKDSPYRSLRQNTQRSYDYLCGILERTNGKRVLARLTGKDLFEMYKNIRRPPGTDGPPRERLARMCVQQMMRVLINYGIFCNYEPCFRLDTILSKVTFRVPEEREQPKKQRVAMTFAQAEAIVKKGLAKGTKRHARVALGVAAQFEFTMSQIDVIGEWIMIKGRRDITPGEIVRTGKVWRPGLRFEDFASGSLSVVRSKTAVGAEYDTSAYPLFQQALAAVPENERTGAVVVKDNGDPIAKRYYVELFRELADEAGVPKNVWNMHARHGGLTEGYNAIMSSAGEGKTELNDLRIHGQHADLQTTTAIYVRPGAEPTRRVAKARVALRAKKGNAA